MAWEDCKYSNLSSLQLLQAYMVIVKQRRKSLRSVVETQWEIRVYQVTIFGHECKSKILFSRICHCLTSLMVTINLFYWVLIAPGAICVNGYRNGYGKDSAVKSQAVKRRNEWCTGATTAAGPVIVVTPRSKINSRTTAGRWPPRCGRRTSMVSLSAEGWHWQRRQPALKNRGSWGPG